MTHIAYKCSIACDKYVAVECSITVVGGSAIGNSGAVPSHITVADSGAVANGSTVEHSDTSKVTAAVCDQVAIYCNITCLACRQYRSSGIKTCTG